MPSEVYENEIQFEVDLLESVPLTTESDEAERASFPFPLLRTSKARQSVRFRSVVLENSYLKVTILPELGGRIIGILDRRTGTEILDPSPRLEVEPGSARGVKLNRGIQWSTSGDRLNDLGPVDYRLVDPDEGESPAGIWMEELVAGTSLSIHVGLSLPPDAAELKFEMRTFNRRLKPAFASPFLTVLATGGAEIGPGRVRTADFDAIYCNGSDSGVAVEFDRWEVRYSDLIDGALKIGRFQNLTGVLGPRQLDSWTVSLFPISGLGALTAVGEGIFCCLDDKSIRFQSSKQLRSHKVLLLTKESGTVEAPLDVYPERISHLDTSGLPSPSIGVIVLDQHRREVLRWRHDDEVAGNAANQSSRDMTASETCGTVVSEPPDLNPRNGDEAEHTVLGSRLSDRAFSDGIKLLFDGGDPRDDLHYASTNLGLRAAALSALGIYELRQTNFADAANFFEESLLYNAEDHLTWWMKALAHRLNGETTKEGPELLNAHYLAPLDPILRAEGFLAQSDQGKAPNPLVKPLADNPDALVEVACLLYDCRLFGELSKWVDEASRHRDVPTLRYILADALLLGSRMTAEAAQHVQTAAKAPINPPYPWRPTERRVMEHLSSRFPGDKRIGELLKMMRWSS